MVSFSAGQDAARFLLDGPQRYTCLTGGTRSGKTFLIIRAILERASNAPDSRHALLRFRANAAKASIAQETLPRVMRLCFPGLKLREHRSDGIFELENGARLTIGGLDDAHRVEKILGLEYASVFLNEASQISYDSALIAFTRLAQVVPELAQRAYVDLNPTSKTHWTNVLFGEKRDPLSNRRLPQPELYARAFLNPRDNAENLTPEFLQSLAALPERKRKRFYEGVYVEEVDDALWSYEIFDRYRCDEAAIAPNERRSVVVAVDPSGAAGRDDTGSDEIGIIVAARGTDGAAYILADRSCRESPAVWSRRVVTAYHEFGCGLCRSGRELRRRHGGGHDQGGGRQRSRPQRHGKSRQGCARRADLVALRRRAGSSRRPFRETGESALRLYRRRLRRPWQPRPRGCSGLGADAPVRGGGRQRPHRILPLAMHPDLIGRHHQSGDQAEWSIAQAAGCPGRSTPTR